MQRSSRPMEHGNQNAPHRRIIVAADFNFPLSLYFARWKLCPTQGYAKSVRINTNFLGHIRDGRVMSRYFKISYDLYYIYETGAVVANMLYYAPCVCLFSLAVFTDNIADDVPQAGGCCARR